MDVLSYVGQGDLGLPSALNSEELPASSKPPCHVARDIISPTQKNYYPHPNNCVVCYCGEFGLLFASGHIALPNGQGIELLMSGFLETCA